MSDRAARAADQSDPVRNPAFRGWHRAPLPRDSVSLNRLADLELKAGNFRFADHLAWLAEGLREAAP